jgi:hypothetical protein
MIKSKLTTEEIIKLYDKGMSVYNISSIAKITQAAIWKRLRLAGHEMRGITKGTQWRKNQGQEEFLGADGRYWVRHYHKRKHRTSERRYVVVMEKHLGHAIPKGWVVHHIDEDPTNDSIDNLCLMTHAAHSKLHHRGKKNLKKNSWKKDSQGKYYR